MMVDRSAAYSDVQSAVLMAGERAVRKAEQLAAKLVVWLVDSKAAVTAVDWAGLWAVH